MTDALRGDGETRRSGDGMEGAAARSGGERGRGLDEGRLGGAALEEILRRCRPQGLKPRHQG